MKKMTFAPSTTLMFIIGEFMKSIGGTSKAYGFMEDFNCENYLKKFKLLTTKESVIWKIIQNLEDQR